MIGSQLIYCTPTDLCISPILPDNHESTNNCSTDSQSLLSTAQCDLIWRGKLIFIFMFFYITAKLFLFIIDLYSSDAMCLCRNAIASFHIRISGRPCNITWIFLQIQCSIILYKLYWLDCICVCRLPMVMCRINAVLCLQNLVLSTYNIQMSGHNCQIGGLILMSQLLYSFIFIRQIVLVL